MTAASAWGPAQDVAYHLERAITKETSALLLVGGDLVPQARAVLKEAGDWVQTAHAGVEAMAVKGKKRQASKAQALKCLKAAERKGVEAAALLFQEKIAAKDVAAICSAISEAVARELDALEALLGLR